MKNSKEREQILALIFAQHLAVNVFHLTSDDQAFKNINNARAHAANLEDKTVAICNRDGSQTVEGADLEPAKEVLEPKIEKTPDQLALEAAEKEAAEKLLAEKAALKAARDKYKTLAGKGVNNAWSIEEVNAKIVELETKK